MYCTQYRLVVSIAVLWQKKRDDELSKSHLLIPILTLHTWNRRKANHSSRCNEVSQRWRPNSSRRTSDGTHCTAQSVPFGKQMQNISVKIVGGSRVLYRMQDSLNYQHKKKLWKEHTQEINIHWRTQQTKEEKEEKKTTLEEKGKASPVTALFIL